MAKALKNRASKQPYISAGQLVLAGFESPFSHHLLSSNRWVKLAHRIPWDALVNTYQRQLGNQYTGASSINPRVAIGAVIIKHLCNLSDRETILQIQENMYMQYFIGYTSFSHEEPFDPSLFVDIRKRLTLEHINEINEKILGLIKSKRRGIKSPSRLLAEMNMRLVMHRRRAIKMNLLLSSQIVSSRGNLMKNPMQVLY